MNFEHQAEARESCGGKTFVHTLLLWQAVRFRERMNQDNWHSIGTNTNSPDRNCIQHENNLNTPQKETDHECICGDYHTPPFAGGGDDHIVEKMLPKQNEEWKCVHLPQRSPTRTRDFSTLSLWIGCILAILVSMYVSYMAIQPILESLENTTTSNLNKCFETETSDK